MSYAYYRPIYYVKEETVPQDVIGRLIEIGRWYGKEISGDETKAMGIWRESWPLQVVVDQKQLESVDSRCTREIQPRIAMAKSVFNTKRNIFTSKLESDLRGKKLVKCYIWSIAFYGDETRTLGKVDQKYLESCEMWCWRRREKIIWTDRVRNVDVLRRVKGKRNILYTIKRWKYIWIGQILRGNWLSKTRYWTKDRN